MFKISDIVSDIARGCAANNMVKDKFSYRIIFYLNEGGAGTKHCIDTAYGDLQKSLEQIIRNNLTVTNNLVIAQTTIRKDGVCVCLQSRAYPFNLEEYFRQITGICKSKSKSMPYGQICGKY